MLLVGHRGDSFEAPENTRAAFRLAWKAGVGAVEFDVHMTRDERILVIHDENALRTTGQNLAIRDRTFAELRDLDAGSWKHPRWAGEKIPELGEVIRQAPEHGRLFVEIKCGPEILPVLKRVLVASGLPSGAFAVLSFSADVLREAHRILPGYETLLNIDIDRDELSANEVVDRCRANLIPAAGLAYGGRLDLAYARTIKAAGLALFVWTVDDPREAEKVRAWGADYLATNRPALLAGPD